MSTKKVNPAFKLHIRIYFFKNFLLFLKKTWFKSAFEPTTTAADCNKSKKSENDFSNDNDSINFDELDINNINNNKESRSKTELNFSVVCNDITSSNWIENFAPCTVSDLAIHTKKLNEVQDWFRAHTEKTNKVVAPILLLTGPSGCGKSTVIKILAKEFGYTISEWVTPVDIEFTRYDKYDSDKSTYSESQNDKFAQFLFQSSRYRSVFDTSSKRLVLVEDFPNVFIKNSSNFEGILEYVYIFPLILLNGKIKFLQINVEFFSIFL